MYYPFFLYSLNSSDFNIQYVKQSGKAHLQKEYTVYNETMGNAQFNK